MSGFVAFEPLSRVYSKEKRKAQLRAAAQDNKQTGKAKAVFEASVDVYACGPLCVWPCRQSTVHSSAQQTSQVHDRYKLGKNL